MASLRLQKTLNRGYWFAFAALSGLAFLLALAWGGCTLSPVVSPADEIEQAVSQVPPKSFKLEEPLFVFATIADSHITSTFFDDHRYLKALSISRKLLANVVRDINAYCPMVDFVVHLGDITDFGTASEFDNARRILDELRCPLFPVVGNHDNFSATTSVAGRILQGETQQRMHLITRVSTS